MIHGQGCPCHIHWPGQESNLQALRHLGLSQGWLPISPPGRFNWRAKRPAKPNANGVAVGPPGENGMQIEGKTFFGGPGLISFSRCRFADNDRGISRPPWWIPWLGPTTRPALTTILWQVAGGSCGTWRSQKALYSYFQDGTAVVQERGSCRGSGDSMHISCRSCEEIRGFSKLRFSRGKRGRRVFTGLSASKAVYPI